MARPTAMDEQFVHQIPELLPERRDPHPHWRESYFFELHRPDARGRRRVLHDGALPGARASWTRCRWDGSAASQLLGVIRPALRRRPAHHRRRPARGSRSCGRSRRSGCGPIPTVAAIGLDLTFRARTQPYGLRRGTMRAGRRRRLGPVPHPPVRAPTRAPTRSDGTTHEVDGWIGQRDHSWGIRDHGRCPLWMWFQIQLDDGFLGVWHWELANGARVYTDGCWAGSRRQRPGPDRRLPPRRRVDRRRRRPGPLRRARRGDRRPRAARATFTLEGGRRITVEAEGTFDRPYEPFHRGGLNQMRVRADDGREGTAIYEVTGARHHRYFPDTDRRRDAAVMTDQLLADRRHARGPDRRLAHRRALRSRAVIEGAAVVGRRRSRRVGTGQMCDSVRLAPAPTTARPTRPRAR